MVNLRTVRHPQRTPRTSNSDWTLNSTSGWFKSVPLSSTLFLTSCSTTQRRGIYYVTISLTNRKPDMGKDVINPDSQSQGSHGLSEHHQSTEPIKLKIRLFSVPKVDFYVISPVITYDSLGKIAESYHHSHNIINYSLWECTIRRVYSIIQWPDLTSTCILNHWHTFACRGL